jgi:hypothetical protein
MRFRKCGQGQDDTGTARRHGDDTSGATDGDVRNMFSYCKARAFLLVSYKKTFLHTGAMRALNRSIKTTHTGAFICLLQETDEAPPPPSGVLEDTLHFPVAPRILGIWGSPGLPLASTGPTTRTQGLCVSTIPNHRRCCLAPPLLCLRRLR